MPPLRSGRLPPLKLTHTTEIGLPVSQIGYGTFLYALLMTFVGYLMHSAALAFRIAPDGAVIG